MQTLDVRTEMEPIQYTEAVQSRHSDKKAAKEPGTKGASFLDMIQKLVAEGTDSRTAAVNAEHSAEAVVRNKNAAAVELSRLKIKGGQKKHDGLTSQAGAKDQESVFLHETADAEHLQAAVEPSIEIKSGFELTVEKEQPNQVQAFEAETVSDEEAAVLLSAGNEIFKKQKKEDDMLSGSAAAPGSTGKPRSDHTDKKDSAQDESGFMPAKTAKVQQTKQPKPVFTVIDERTAQFAPVSADGSVHEAGAAVRTETTASVDMLMDFRGTPAGVAAKAEGGMFAKESGGQSFSALVAQQVQDMSSDFVQAGRIVLQDNNTGIIRLQLQPAHLGNVRINLELAGDKKIVGKIITGSKEAYQAFKESIEQLSEAFEQGGFASAQFDVSWSGESGGQQFAHGDSSFNESFFQNERLEVMHDNHYADTQAVYTFGQEQAVSVFA
ncbi:MAG: flagellar hook-length control protein FliK [Treponema sp.]